jgi:hypothetical protein
MIKAFKWAYNRGVQHERLRIKYLISEFERDAKHRYDEFNMRPLNPGEKRPPKIQLEIDAEVHRVLNILTMPDPGYGIVNEPLPAPIDEDQS